MLSAFDYRAMARECLKHAAAAKDVDRKQSLLDIAKIYMETANSLETRTSEKFGRPHGRRSARHHRASST